MVGNGFYGNLGVMGGVIQLLGPKLFSCARLFTDAFQRVIMSE